MQPEGLLSKKPNMLLSRRQHEFKSRLPLHPSFPKGLLLLSTSCTSGSFSSSPHLPFPKTTTLKVFSRISVSRRKEMFLI